MGVTLRSRRGRPPSESIRLDVGVPSTIQCPPEISAACLYKAAYSEGTKEFEAYRSHTISAMAAAYAIQRRRHIRKVKMEARRRQVRTVVSHLSIVVLTVCFSTFEHPLIICLASGIPASFGSFQSFPRFTYRFFSAS